jgi:hypothetical protein
MLALLGLRDDYRVDGRVLIEDMTRRALPATLRDTPVVRRAGELYTQLLAGEGRFALDTLAASTRALAGGTPADDHTYTTIEASLIALDNRRDAITDAMNRMLLDAAFAHRPVDTSRATALNEQAQRLLADANGVALGPA